MSEITAGVLGLGIMGGEFAAHIAAAGVRTLGFDLLPAKRDALKARGGVPCASAAEVAKEADVIITSLPSVAAMEAAFCGDEGHICRAARNGDCGGEHVSLGG